MKKETIQEVVNILKSFDNSDSTYPIIDTEKDNEKLMLSKGRGGLSITLMSDYRLNNQLCIKTKK